MVSRADFLAACGTIFDALASHGSAAPAGSGAGHGSGAAPKFDTSISRKGGMVQYASETDLDGLIFWKSRAEEPASDPKYADSNAKQAKSLGYWIAYRQQQPTAVWSGERNRVPVTAHAPSAKPETYARGAPSGASAAPAEPTPTLSDDDDSDIPF